MTSGASGDFALSMGSIAKLKYSARTSPDEGIKEAAKQFEALFLQQMLKQMRDAIPQSGLLNSQRSEMYQSLMDQQWAQTLSQRGIGLADMLTEQLQGKGPKSAQPADAVDSFLASIPNATPQPLRASDPVEPRRADNAPADDLARKEFPRPPLQAAVNEELAEGSAALGIGPWLAEILPAHHVAVGLVAVMEHHLRRFSQRPHLEIDECQVSHACLLRQWLIKVWCREGSPRVTAR